MIGKTTTQLLKELENFNTFEEYENANRDSMISKNLSEYLTDLLNERNLTKAEVIRKAELSDGYAYQIFSGLKTAPKRDKLICLSIGMFFLRLQALVQLFLPHPMNLHIENSNIKCLTMIPLKFADIQVKTPL